MSDEEEERPRRPSIQEAAEDLPKNILGFGNPLLDLMTSGVAQSVLDEWGAELNNAILAEEKHQPLFKKLVDDGLVTGYVAGGATLNSIRVAQWLLSFMDHGGCTGYLGCVGKDGFGDKMKEQLEADKVKALFQTTEEKPTGTCAVLVKGGERSLIANLAAAEKYDFAHFESPQIQMAVNMAEIYYCASFPLTHQGGAKTVLALAKQACEANKTMCLNISAPFICQVPPFRAALMEVLKFCNYVFCNESEAEELATALEWEEAAQGAAAIAKRLASLESETRLGLTAVVTQGSEATVVASPPNVPAGLPEATVATYPVTGNPWTLSGEQITDTNGAGDAFVGGFLSQLALPDAVSDAQKVHFGHFAAGVIIQNSGCTCPDLEGGKTPAGDKWDDVIGTGLEEE